MSATPDDVISFAKAEVGYNRYNDPETGSKYGRYYAELVNDASYAANDVPYCAMFVTYVYNELGVKCEGMPGAYVPDIVNKTKEAGRAVSKDAAQPGDYVMFDWESDGLADHIGIVVSNDPETASMICCEGNTAATWAGSQSNGGCVALRTRYYHQICCVGRPYYEESEDDMTDEQAGMLKGIYDSCAGWMQGTYNEVMRTDDPTGGNRNSTTHEEVKWLAYKVERLQTDVASLIYAVEEIASKLGVAPLQDDAEK